MSIKQLNTYFENIRDDKKALEAFFLKIPKGADLHHHALGAIWGEDILEKAKELDLWVNPLSGQLSKAAKKGYQKIRTVASDNAVKDQLIDHWSIRNFNGHAQMAAAHFFAIFPKLEAVFVGQELFWLKKIAQAAAQERICYIETLIDVPEIRDRVSLWASTFNQWPTSPSITDFESLYKYLETKGLNNAVHDLVETVEGWQQELAKEKEAAKIGIQVYAIRTFEAKEVFAQLALGFKAASLSKDVLGVNLVAPEHDPRALKDYGLHIQFCKWLKLRFPNVKLALHAGELTEDLVPLEDLLFHIDTAVGIASCCRIGHGVDILYETAHDTILKQMQQQQIAVEILLDSNAFILGVDSNQHPLLAYWKANVPIVIATDDPALLRISLADQYIKAASSFPELQYTDFKQIIINSIQYSFLEEAERLKILQQLKFELSLFEQSILEGTNYGKI